MHFDLFFSNTKTLFPLRRRSRIACAPSQDDPIFRTFFASSFVSVPRPSSGTTFYTFFPFLTKNGSRKCTEGGGDSNVVFGHFRIPELPWGAPGLPDLAAGGYTKLCQSFLACSQKAAVPTTMRASHALVNATLKH